MHSKLLQNWTTLQGSLTVTQSAPAWLDLHRFEDLFFLVQITQSANSLASLYVQTSPDRSDGSFMDLLRIPITSLGTSPLVTRVPAVTSSTRPARYLRWHLTSDGSYQITFRVFACLAGPRRPSGARPKRGDQ